MPNITTNRAITYTMKLMRSLTFIVIVIFIQLLHTLLFNEHYFLSLAFQSATYVAY